MIDFVFKMMNVVFKMVIFYGNVKELGGKAWLDSILSKKHAAIDEWQTEMQLRAERCCPHSSWLFDRTM